jgi:hypothetical protein
MVSEWPNDQTNGLFDGPIEEPAKMPRNDDIRRQLVGRPNTVARAQTTRLRQETNHPVPIDEFDREGMGVAAKE